MQVGALYRVMAEEARARLVANLAGSFAQVRDQAVIDRFISYLWNAEREYGESGVAGRAVRQPCQAHLARSA